ncbi:hypothetical protein BFS16_05840 [Hoylesella timonensis]|uniref:Glycosyl transferase family 1 domain-containing protein n=1 Tax=Hoylesella timonensis TaxID=386414 RepID=A0A2K0XL22_9BACT|nr:glycosyltransferase [Hoylesella timonensis]PNP95240.1 hypothetical protein BFS16_05840 [Hoylesella timonensis]
MNILLDFIPLQDIGNGGIGGAATFTYSVYESLLSRTEEKPILFAAYDKRYPVGKQYDYHDFAKQNNITLIDISTRRMADIIAEKQIDVFFIAIGQFYAPYDLKNISCKTIMFIHDIFNVESYDNKIDLSLWGPLSIHKWNYCKRIINTLSGRNRRRLKRIYKNIIPLFNSPLTRAYTVSNYSREALYYYFPEINKPIDVCYSPKKEVLGCPDIENEQLNDIIESQKKYLLLIAANRIYKNAQVVMKAFSRLQAEYNDLYLVTLNYGQSVNDHHIDIAFLNENDLEKAYQHAYALLFPSLFEGFGYPPIEAMKYGTPIIASNVTSIPEILGNAGIYFSPLYPADLYRAIKVVIGNRDINKTEMEKRYKEITNKQQNDLNNLIAEILSKK